MTAADGVRPARARPRGGPRRRRPSGPRRGSSAAPAGPRAAARPTCRPPSPDRAAAQPGREGRGHVESCRPAYSPVGRQPDRQLGPGRDARPPRWSPGSSQTSSASLARHVVAPRRAAAPIVVWPGWLTMLKVPTGREPSTQSAMSRQSTYCSGRSYGPRRGHAPARRAIRFEPERHPADDLVRAEDEAGPGDRHVAVELRERGELAAALGRGVVGAVGRGRVAVDDRRALVGARPRSATCRRSATRCSV